MGDLKITKGEWKNYGLNVRVDSDSVIARCFSQREDSLKRESPIGENNAQLIAEAGTIANATGLTPNQILKQRDELLSQQDDLLNALEMMLSRFENTDCNMIKSQYVKEEAKEAIEKMKK